MLIGGKISELPLDIEFRSIKGWSKFVKEEMSKRGENLFFADFNIPKNLSDQFSGVGEIMLDDALAFFRGNKKFPSVVGTLDLYIKSANYTDYGGQSIILKQFWNWLGNI